MNRAYGMVKQFHVASGVEMPSKPMMLDNGGGYSAEEFSLELDRISRHMKFNASSGFGGQVVPRAAYMLEELAEFLVAPTIEDQADAIIDLMYFAMGTFTLMGIQPERLFDIVAQSNLGKILPDGTVLRDETGKITKPEGWKEKYSPEPLIRSEIEQQMRTSECGTCKGERKPALYGLECPECEVSQR